MLSRCSSAHLATLVCTDDRYLKAQGLPLSIIKGCVPVDTAAYDVPKQVESVGALRAKMYTSVFGIDLASQKEVSPATHVSKGKNIPSFLLLHVADRPDSTAQSQAFAKRLQAAWVSATLVPAEGKTHGTINSDLGAPADKPTQAMWEFLQGALKQ